MIAARLIDGVWYFTPQGDAPFLRVGVGRVNGLEMSVLLHLRAAKRSTVITAADT